MWVQNEPVLPEEPKRHRLIIPLALLVAVLLVAGAIAVGVVGADGDDKRGAVTAKGHTIPVTPEGAETAGLAGVELQIAQSIPALMQLVQDKRGLPFKEPVEVTLLGDKAFRQRLLGVQKDEADDEKAKLETSQRVLHALGLLEKNVDLADAQDELLGDAVAGFYDTEDDDLVVRGEKLSASVRVTFVHELTHALQDQYFDLDRKDIEDRDDEASQAFTSVIEGDAVRIEQMYLDTLPESEQKAAEREDMEAASGISPDIPQILLELISFPYAVGPDFTRAVVEAGGQAKLDEAFRNPPTTSEQILHPDLYVQDGEPPRKVAEPEAGRKVIDRGVIGQLGMILILRRILDDQVAFVASQGWGGDRYVAWRRGDATCVRTNLVMDTAKDAQEMAAALRQVAKKRSNVEVSIGRDVLSFTSCG